MYKRCIIDMKDEREFQKRVVCITKFYVGDGIVHVNGKVSKNGDSIGYVIPLTEVRVIRGYYD